MGATVALLLLLLRGAAGQQSSLAVNLAYPCKSAAEYFDTSSLQCKACNQVGGHVA